MKVKVDKCKVFCKKRQQEFEILVFEPPKHMWAYDCFPESDILAIDDDKDAYKLLKYIMWQQGIASMLMEIRKLW